MKRTIVLIGLAAALVLAVLSPLASSLPDGLERVAEDHGFLERAEGPSYQLLTDYTVPGVGDEPTSTVLAGIVGSLLVFAVAYGVGRAVKRGRAAGAQ
ncbi:MAG: PDGLE domain-containing protein [Anaerolineae bacterium]